MASAHKSTLKIKWTDENISKGGLHQRMTNRLEKLASGNFMNYEDLNQCVNDIAREDGKQNVILIVSNASGSKIVPVIHTASCIRAIYIFCGNVKRAEEWAGPYMSIIYGIFSDSDLLVQQMEQDLCSSPPPPKIKPFSSQDAEMPLISVFRVTDGQRGLKDLQKESATFIWYRLLIDAIRQLGEINCSRADMVQVARMEYTENQSVMTKIAEFENDYASSDAVKWYSSNSFVYRLLNRALRTENIDTIFKFRLFINDLHNQIVNLYQDYKDDNQPLATHNRTVYRGQRLRREEMEMMKQSVDGIISMNTFLSASFLPEVAEAFSGISVAQTAEGMESVVFVIKINDLSQNTTPFASIWESSCNPHEYEVLFTIGAIFRVASIDFDSDPKRIHLQLINHEDPLYRNFYEHTLQQIGHGRASPLTLGWFLYRMNDFNRAEYYAQLLLEQIDPDDIDSGNAYNLLGLIYKARGRLEDAIEAYEKAVEILQRYDEQGSPRLIVCHYNIALAHLAAQDERSANDHYLEARDLFNKSPHRSNRLLQSMLQGLEGRLEAAFGFLEKAIESLKIALETKKQSLPVGHAAIGSAWKELGKVYFQKGEEEKALDAFDEAIRIFGKILVEKHIDCYDCHVQKGQIYFNHQEYRLAIIEFEKAFDILTEHARDDLKTIDSVKELIDYANALGDL